MTSDRITLLHGVSLHTPACSSLLSYAELFFMIVMKLACSVENSGLYCLAQVVFMKQMIANLSQPPMWLKAPLRYGTYFLPVDRGRVPTKNLPKLFDRYTSAVQPANFRHIPLSCTSPHISGLHVSSKSAEMHRTNVNSFTSKLHPSRDTLSSAQITSSRML